MKFLIHHKVVLDILFNKPFATDLVAACEALGARGNDIVIPEITVMAAIADSSLPSFNSDSSIVETLRGCVTETNLPSLDRRIEVLVKWHSLRTLHSSSDPFLLLYVAICALNQYELILPVSLMPSVPTTPSRVRQLATQYSVLQFQQV